MAVPVLWQLQTALSEAYEAKNCTSSQLHGHRHFLITLISRGRGIQTINGTAYPFEENDLFFLSPADFHRNTIAPGETFDYYGVKFNYEMVDERLSGLCAMDRFPIHIRLPEAEAARIRQIFAELCREMQEEGACIASREYQQSLIEQLVILVMRRLPAAPSASCDSFINRSLGFVYSHFSEPITVSDAAAYIGYTPNYFNSRFRKAIGASFGDFLHRLRLSYSENLLCAGTASVTEIAMASGFNSLSHFSHSFRAKNGISPQEYRKRKASAS